ncbi:uncharacterized protein LOC114333828 [Diabrotica virgifera virgifera]|uniref:Diacylglycerol O-acyltransferase n=1 Tax=Diabrotica virgifera virgifera TaxID=50390 RepID=A0ABM5IRF2_DIAVI|nr:uncharacterized protein LOC114333828 [Diabrotica virgifera virgifera]
MTLAYLVASIPVLPFYLLFLLIFFIFKQIVFVILRYKYGSRLVELNHADTYYCVGEVVDNSIVLFMILNSDLTEEDMAKKIENCVDTKLVQNAKQIKNLFTSLNSTMGYNYLLAEEALAKNHVSILDVQKRGWTTLHELAYEYSSEPLPLNKYLWEMVVVKATDQWKVQNGFKKGQVIVYIRLHHAISDGLSGMNLLCSLIGNSDTFDNFLKTMSKNIKTKNSVLQFLQNLYFFFIIPGLMVVEIYKITKDKTLWRNKSCNGKNRFAIKVEDGVVEKVAAIRRELKTCTFSEVLLTATSKAFYDYFKNKKMAIPVNLGTFLVSIADLSNMNVNGIPQLKNRFGIVALPLPVDVKSDSMVTRLNAVKEFTRNPEISVPFTINYYFYTHLLGYFPPSIKMIFLPVKFTTLAISNLPPIDKITVFGNVDLDDMYFFTLNRDELAIGVGLFTYGKKVHLGLKVNEEFMPLQEDCEKFLENIIKAVEKMRVEVTMKRI